MQEIHIFQHGGIGDQIVGLPIITFLAFKNPNAQIVLYTKWPEVAEVFLPSRIKIKTRGDFNKNLVSWWIELIDVINFKFNHRIDRSLLPPECHEIYDAWLKNYPAWGRIIEHHPGSCNEMAELAIKHKLNRRTLCFHLLGVKPIEFTYDVAPVKRTALLQDFITVHEGFDSSHNYDHSMKSWHMAHWEDFVEKFGQRWPRIKIIQLGGAKHRQIDGVDQNLAGKLPFKESMRYLKGARLHVDGDSGLVHARTLFGKPSIVMFGPTSMGYFAYPQNINISPKVCGNCWWKKSNWMQYCVNGYETNRCMDSITPDMVLDEIEKSGLLKKGGTNGTGCN